MELTYERYSEPRNDLVIEAIQNGFFVNGDIWRTFLNTCDAIQIIAVGFSGITEDNFKRHEIDKYYIFNLYGTDYLIWSYIAIDENTHDESFPTQIAHKAIRTNKTIENWDIEESI